jgi:hypothetical protein
VLEEKLTFKQLKDYCTDFVGDNTVADAYAERQEATPRRASYCRPR